MSKTDDMRAMREARYAAPRTPRTAVAKPDAGPEAPPKAPRRASKADSVSAPAAAPAPAQDGLCGHRAISGRTCTREQGHAAKSHRYS